MSSLAHPNVFHDVSMMWLICASWCFVLQIVDLFDWLVQPCLDFIDRECRFVVQTSPIHLTYSLMKLYTCLMGSYESPLIDYSCIIIFVSVCACVCVCVLLLACVHVLKCRVKRVWICSPTKDWEETVCVFCAHTRQKFSLVGEVQRKSAALFSYFCLANVSPITLGVIGCHRSKQCMNSIKLIYPFQDAQANWFQVYNIITGGGQNRIWNRWILLELLLRH